MPATRIDPLLLMTIAADAATLDRVRFLQKYRRPVLVAIRWRESAWSGAAYDSTARNTAADHDTDSDRAAAPCWEIPADAGPVVTLGRAPDNDIVIPEPNLSKWHLELVSTASGWVVRDLGSRNGTWVEADQVQLASPHPLESGQTLVVGGSVRLRFLFPAGLWDFLSPGGA